MTFGHDATAPGAGSSRPLSQTPQGRNGVGRVLIAVGIVAVLINGLAFSASQLWVCPDSSYYVALAGGIADDFDFTNELFLIRPPGYPLMLAAIFRLFGSASPTGILVVQHAMVVGVALVTALIGWYLTERRTVALLGGVMCAASLQLLTFANVIITEVPFTLVFLSSVCFLVKFHRRGGAGTLALASLMAAVSYLFRPIGIAVLPFCVAAAAHRVWSPWRDGESTISPSARDSLGHLSRWLYARVWWSRATAGLVLALVPALGVMLPVAALNTAVHGTDLPAPCGTLALYLRLLAMDRLDSTSSEALTDIRAVVNEAIERRHLPPHADWREWGPVWHAYETVRGVPLKQSSAIMADACRDLIRENPRATLENTIRYSYWLLMVPDSFYRFHPGGAPGVITPTGESERNTTAEIFDVRTYEPMMRPWVDPYSHYIALSGAPKPTTPMWRGFARWFYRHVENGRPLLGMGDSLYEQFTWLCLMGIVLALATRERATWLLVAGVIACQIVPSAFFGGPTPPRYAVPVKPLMLLYGAFLVVFVLRAAVAALYAGGLVPRLRLGFGSS